ncbi:MAG: hypothetical protein U1E23_00835 [Reyranellaceae bacterium]
MRMAVPSAIALALAVALALPAQAQTPPAAKQAPPSVPGTLPPPQPQRPLPTLNIVVSDRDRSAVLAFYREEIAAGRCPVPMVRRGGECAAADKKPWRLDQAIADDVKLEPLPGPLILKLSASPAGYQYLCWGHDVLLVGVGTRIVTAWVADLSRL